MPYWSPEEKQFDVHGNEIKIGDVLMSTKDHPDHPKYFVCYKHPHSSHIELRDLDFNNICMCDLGKMGNVVNLGHYTLNQGILSNEDIRWYFDFENYFNKE